MFSNNKTKKSKQLDGRGEIHVFWLDSIHSLANGLEDGIIFEAGLVAHGVSELEDQPGHVEFADVCLGRLPELWSGVGDDALHPVVELPAVEYQRIA